MKIALGTVEISDRQREAIAFFYGVDGLASRDLCRWFITRNGTESIDDQEATLSAWEDHQREA